jgi:hypothetical protein
MSHLSGGEGSLRNPYAPWTSLAQIQVVCALKPVSIASQRLQCSLEAYPSATTKLRWLSEYRVVRERAKKQMKPFSDELGQPPA